MPDTVLLTSRFAKSMMARFSARFDLLDTAGKPPEQCFGADELGRVRALLTMGAQPLGAAQMDRLPALGAIVCYGTGYDGVDLGEAKRRGIVVANSPAANASAVADMAMTLLLAVTRRLLAADDYVRSGGWAKSTPAPMLRAPRGLRDRRVGVYGMGEIGHKIATRAAAFETKVGYFSRSRHDVPYDYQPGLGDLVDWCDVLMVAVRAGPETERIIDAEMLKRLGPDGVVVNISRGSVIDQDALLEALSTNAIAGAGLDVFAQEPHVPDQLSALPNVVLTPHIGGHTSDAHVAMQDCAIANLEAFFAGRPVPYAVVQ